MLFTLFGEGKDKKLLVTDWQRFVPRRGMQFSSHPGGVYRFEGTPAGFIFTPLID